MGGSLGTSKCPISPDARTADPVSKLFLSFKTWRWVQENLPLIQCSLPYLFLSNFWCDCASLYCSDVEPGTKWLVLELPFLQHRQTRWKWKCRRSQHSHPNLCLASRHLDSSLGLFLNFRFNWLLRTIPKGWMVESLGHKKFAVHLVLVSFLLTGVQPLASVDGNGSFSP